MKICRATKCSLKYLTTHKRDQLNRVLEEYRIVTNFFIDRFWNSQIPSKKDLLKPIVDLPETWLSTRLRKVSARQAIDLIQSALKKFESDQKNQLKKKKPRPLIPTKPEYRSGMSISSTIGTFTESKTLHFDAWLQLRSMGNKIKIDVPIKKHKHFNRWAEYPTSKMLNSFIIHPTYIQFVFEIETGPKRTEGKCIGIDSGINALASTSDSVQLGLDIKEHIERVKRCKQGSKGQIRARRALKQRIDEIAKEAVKKDLRLVVVEKLKNLNHNTKLKRRLSKNMRRSIGTWNYRYWLQRISMRCEVNRVSFRSVVPYYTSQRCSVCGYTDRRNRSNEKFLCLNCSYETNADVNAAKNILDRFLTGPYGAGFKPS